MEPVLLDPSDTEHESFAIPKIPGRGQREHDEELSPLSTEIHSLFPELSGGEFSQEKKVVTSLLVSICETGRLGSPQEIRALLPKGFAFTNEICELQEEYQVIPGKRAQAIAGVKEGWIYFYPAFFHDPDYNDPERQAHILAHELGEVIQRTDFRQTDHIAGTETITPFLNTEKHDALIDVRDPSWNGVFIEQLYGHPPYKSEARADDIACYLRAANAKEWLRNRILSFAPTRRDELLGEMDTDMLDDPRTEIGEMYMHAQDVFDFLEEEIGEKKQFLAAHEGEGGYDFSLAEGFEHVALNTGHVDSQVLQRFYDKLFGVG